MFKKSKKLKIKEHKNLPSILSSERFSPFGGQQRAQEPMKTSKKRSIPVRSNSPTTTDLRAAFSSNYGPVLSYSNMPNWLQYSRQDSISPFRCYRSGVASVFRPRCCQGSRHGHECFISRSELPVVSRPRQVGAEMLPEPNCHTDSRCSSERNRTESRSVSAAAPQLPGRSELASVSSTKPRLNI